MNGKEKKLRMYMMKEELKNDIMTCRMTATNSDMDNIEVGSNKDRNL